MDFKLSEEEVAHLERLARERDAEGRRWRPLAVVFVTMMVALTIFGILHSDPTSYDEGWLSGATLIQSL